MLFRKDKNIESIKTDVEQIITDLHQITTEIKHQTLAETVGDLKERITEPYMFVIVGEVKAGKSSFINALLKSKEEICKVAAHPMTDTIQQITYGEEQRIEDVNPYLKKIYQPFDILKEIAIVDTPGTNTIVDHHQEITERFIPASDLIVFVFESKNPYRQSAWDFFDYIQDEWRKKIIFVLQQKDLMEPEDLVTNINGVRDYAKQKGILKPNVYAVSAKMEQAGDLGNSGFLPLRAFIEEKITSGQAGKLKLKNNISTALTINDKIFKGLITRKEQYEADDRFRNDIRETLENQKKKSEKQVDILIENLIHTYDRITGEKYNEMKSGLGFMPMIRRSFKSIMDKKASPKIWLAELAKDLENDLNIELKEKLNEGVIDIAESIQQMGNIVDLKIRNSETILQRDNEIFSEIAERRSNVLKDLQDAFTQFLKTSENFYDDSLATDSENITPNLAAGGGLAIVGVILATVTNGAVFDVTGGLVTTVGLLIAGVGVGLKKRKILKGFEQEIDRGRTLLKGEVSEKLKDYIGNIRDRIDSNFSELDQHLAEEKQSIDNLESRINSIDSNLQDFDKAIQVDL
jgi:ribosome biogenesis GTPase A